MSKLNENRSQNTTHEATVVSALRERARRGALASGQQQPALVAVDT